ncbi:NAD(P)/FAD-dependent oxidoreductase [Streptosporangium sp. NPDC051023]|uniref:FAD-dependent oxidoreductase n=1 Tax=Streptosporangium sp. NPDC051023 TaxID=3155410 RepID=UPI00344B91B4
MTNSRVAIIGGGIGGLCLAQGLRGAGVDVTVYERDRTPADRLQGYRIHIDPAGARALHECLPRELWEAFLATAGKSGQDFGFLTEKMGRLLLLETPHRPDPLDNHHSVSRITLRQVLLSGLSDVVRFGRIYERYTREQDGTITLHFADGTAETADIVVAADGGNSRVRKQYLPHAPRIDTGILTVAGKFPLTDETRDLVAPRLWRGPNMVIPPKGCGMFTAPQEFNDIEEIKYLGGSVPTSGIGRTEQPGALFDNTGDYVMWVFGAAGGRFPDGLSGMTGEHLRDTVARMIAGWHPDLRRLVTDSTPETVSLLPIRTSVPIAPWPATNITLLGDAVHSMTPMRGIGANIALRDACLLARALSGEGDPVTAIAGYEAEMREYGFAAVRRSLMAARQFVNESRLARGGFRTALRAAQRLPALRRRALS